MRNPLSIMGKVLGTLNEDRQEVMPSLLVVIEVVRGSRSPSTSRGKERL